jgi:hypothetical protein
LLGAALVVLAVGGCAWVVPTPSPEPPPTLPPFITLTETPEGIVGAARDITGLHLWVDGYEVTHVRHQGDPPNIYLITYGGATEQIYNSFVFGLAPPGATTFELAGQPGSIGGSVTEGAFVTALKAKDLLRQQLLWTFRNSAGDIVARGTGIKS